MFHTNKLTLIVSAGISVCLVLLCLGMPFSFSPNLFIQHSGKVIPLYGGRVISQSLEPAYPLIGIKLIFKKTNDIEHPLTVALPMGGKPPLFVTLSSQEIRPLQWQAFYFPQPIPIGYPLSVMLTAPIASDSASVSPVLSLLDTYPFGEAVLTTDSSFSLPPKQEVVGDLAFRPIYRVSGWEITKYYLHRISFGKPMSKRFVLGMGLLWIWGLGTLLIYLGWRWFTVVRCFRIIGIVGILILMLLALFYQSLPYFQLR